MVAMNPQEGEEQHSQAYILCHQGSPGEGRVAEKGRRADTKIKKAEKDHICVLLL